MSIQRVFAEELRARKPLLGTFVKLRDPGVVEVLGWAGFDFIVIDAEHAAFGRESLSVSLLAARAAGLAALVRVPETDGHWISSSLDAGAVGIMAPQVANVGMATDLAARMRFGAGGRGFSPSTPAAGYGARGIAAHLASQTEETVLICQIEDMGAVAAAADIAAVNGVDGLLVGPIDLAVSVGLTDPADPAIVNAGIAVMKAAAVKGVSAGMFISNPDMLLEWKQAGANLFVLGADQSFLLQAAGSALARARRAISTNA